MQEILVKIERLRHFLQHQGIVKGIKHPDVIKISQELDVLINQYYKLS